MGERPPESSERSRPPADVRRVVVIANPVSGSPARPPPLPRFLDALSALGIEAAVTRTEGPGHAAELAREACRSEPDALAVVGGDGTLNEVLNGLGDAPIPLAAVPAGTSNILALDLGIPFDPVRAARLLRDGRKRTLDVGLANGRRFLMVVGVGWDAHVVRAVAAGRRGRLGKHRYLVPAVRATFDYGFPRLSVRRGSGGAPRSARLVFACNTRNYAAFFTLTPRARPDDGLLDFLVVTEGAARNLLRWTLAALAGRLPRYREVRCFQGRELRVEAERPVPWQIDGDPGGTTPVTISLDARTLEVIVP